MKVLAEVGAVSAVEALPESDGWTLWITRAIKSGERREPLERQRGGPRVFATLEAAAHTVASAGLREFRVIVKPQ
ncbi:MAG: hypothetical protein WAV81_17445 [Candidatus Competibacter sp.]